MATTSGGNRVSYRMAREPVISPFTKIILLTVSLCVAATAAEAEPRRRALLIGINDYGAARPSSDTAKSGRTFRNLEGAVNDVHTMREMLLSVYKFKPEEIVMLIDGAASRAAILAAIDAHLIAGAQKDDTCLFYFSGHGSQVKNSLSEESDHMDESLVPADSGDGAADIRDKELRRRFHPLLERGVRLTIILDSCHSGSGARGLPGGGQARLIPAENRDARDAFRGPTLEDRGALILSAARDTDLALETRTAEGKPHGVFTWAWTRAVRDAAANEPAIATFQRAAARMALERPEQVPVIAGNAEARFAPFLGARQDRQSDQIVVAVRSIDTDGLVTIEGGWANGLTPNSELRLLTNPPSDVRLRVVALDDVSHCTARVTNGSASSLQSGSLLELVAWAPPQVPPLRIWVPEGNARVVALARALAGTARRARLQWIEDPVETRAARYLRWNGQGWDPADALHGLSAGTPVFVQVPVLPDVSRSIATGRWNVEKVKSPEEADYILTGRLSGGRRLQYAWVRPSVDGSDRMRSPLPLRTDWHDAQTATEIAATLTDDLRRLQIIHLWQTLPSPPEAQFPYRLGIRRTRDGAPVAAGVLIEGEQYGFVLRAGSAPIQLAAPRFIYVFMVDSYGKSVLFFPRGPLGSVENRFPLRGTPAEIPLGPRASLVPEAPLGTDTFFLLSTEQALTNPWILEWDGVRTVNERSGTALDQFILLTMSGDRGVQLTTSSRWSIERLPYATIAPQPIARPGS